VGRPYVASRDLATRVRCGETFALARLISRAESGAAEARDAIGQIYREAGRAHVIGITGVPGSGKSTLVGVLVEKLRALGGRVAIVAIDPSSPYSGGAILGDRIRMAHVALDAGVFIRSMATRGATGGMAHAALDVVDILDFAGFDWIIIETVGVGQDEVEIACASHTTVVVSAPGLGDEIQAIKAGILEIADIHVVSKCDRSDANRTITDLKMMLKEAPPQPGGWRPPVLGISSIKGEGVDELLKAVTRHQAALSGEAGERRRSAIAAFRLSKTAETLALEKLKGLLSRRISEATEQLAARRRDPYAEAARLVSEFMGKDHHA
jgi:LAO/AO transport system kinase